VHMLSSDNWLIYTLWNSKVRRPEIAAAALYEGLVSASALTPWARDRAQLTSRAALVSAPAAGAPVVSHRTFVLPVSVKGLSMTRTHHGITTPHVLLATEGDGVLMLDRRLLDPRRPTGEPREFEKLEGLVQFS